MRKYKTWFAARPRWHLHFVPTYSSWLNLVERFFALRLPGVRYAAVSFRWFASSYNEIDHFVASRNADCKPLSSGPPPPIRSSPSSKDLVYESTGRHTSVASKK